MHVHTYISMLSNAKLQRVRKRKAPLLEEEVGRWLKPSSSGTRTDIYFHTLPNGFPRKPGNPPRIPIATGITTKIITIVTVIITIFVTVNIISLSTIFLIIAIIIKITMSIT